MIDRLLDFWIDGLFSLYVIVDYCIVEIHLYVVDVGLIDSLAYWSSWPSLYSSCSSYFICVAIWFYWSFISKGLWIIDFIELGAVYSIFDLLIKADNASNISIDDDELMIPCIPIHYWMLGQSFSFSLFGLDVSLSSVVLFAWSYSLLGSSSIIFPLYWLLSYDLLVDLFNDYPMQSSTSKGLLFISNFIYVSSVLSLIISFD